MSNLLLVMGLDSKSGCYSNVGGRRNVETYLAEKTGAPLTILDIGSYAVNASYRPLFERPGWRYIGVDIAAGPNVDVVLTSAYQFPFEAGSADMVISGQAFEHIEFFWLTWQEVVRVLKPGGTSC